MLTHFPALLAVGAGLVGGVFLAFSTFVMKALAQLPTEQGVAAMQRINIVVLNPIFLGLFLGTTVIASISGVAAVASWDTYRSALIPAACALYILGCFGVTVAFNVPRNDRLARLPPSSDEAFDYWQVYLKEWVFWNHVRTISSSVCAAIATAWLVF